MNASSDYLNRETRSEAQATLDQCALIRSAVDNFTRNIKQRIQEVGGDPKWIDLSDMLSDAIHDVEVEAQYRVDRAAGDVELEHERNEAGLAMYRSGVTFGKVA